jgi:hypothetical protein
MKNPPAAKSAGKAAASCCRAAAAASVKPPPPPPDWAAARRALVRGCSWPEDSGSGGFLARFARAEGDQSRSSFDFPPCLGGVLWG